MTSRKSAKSLAAGRGSNNSLPALSRSAVTETTPIDETNTQPVRAAAFLRDQWNEHRRQRDRAGADVDGENWIHHARDCAVRRSRTHLPEVTSAIYDFRHTKVKRQKSKIKCCP